MTTIEHAHTQLVDALRSYRAILTAEIDAVDLLLGTLYVAPPPAPPVKVRAKAAPQRTPKVARTAAKKPTKRTATRKAGSRKLAPPLAAHEPAKRIGKLSSKVEVKAAEDEADRKRIVEGLVAKGYSRANLGERLAPDLYDVIRRDGAIVVTWWPQESSA